MSRESIEIKLNEMCKNAEAIFENIKKEENLEEVARQFGKYSVLPFIDNGESTRVFHDILVYCYKKLDCKFDYPDKLQFIGYVVSNQGEPIPYQENMIQGVYDFFDEIYDGDNKKRAEAVVTLAQLYLWNTTDDAADPGSLWDI